MKSRRFGLLDYLIVIVAIAVVGLGINYLRSSDKLESVELKTVTYLAEIGKEDRGFLDNIAIGDEIYHSPKDILVGEIVDYEVRPSEIFHRDTERGEIVILDDPNLVDIKLTLEVEASLKNDVVNVSGEDILVGGGFNIKGKGYESYISIVEIESRGE